MYSIPILDILQCCRLKFRPNLLPLRYSPPYTRPAATVLIWTDHQRRGVPSSSRLLEDGIGTAAEHSSRLSHRVPTSSGVRRHFTASVFRDADRRRPRGIRGQVGSRPQTRPSEPPPRLSAPPASKDAAVFALFARVRANIIVSLADRDRDTMAIVLGRRRRAQSRLRRPADSSLDHVLCYRVFCARPVTGKWAFSRTRCNIPTVLRA